MATEKILNTRIQLKYDSYINWETNNPTLKPGEVAIAYLALSNTATTPDNNTHPVMFKVGPGEFNSLPWASALAADVHAWAKKSEEDFTTWVKGLIDVSDIDAYSKTEADNLLAGKVDNSAFDTYKTTNDAAVKKVADDLAAEAEAARAAEKANADAIAAMKDHASVDSFADVMAEIAKKQDTIPANTYDAHGAAAQALTDAKAYTDELANGAVKANTDAIAVLNGDANTEGSIAKMFAAMGEELLVEFENVDKEIIDIQSEIDAINHAETGILAQAKAHADGKDEAIAAAQKAGDDAQGAVDALAAKVGEVPEDKTVVQMIADAQTAATYDDTKVKEDIAANADAIKAISDDYLKAADKTELEGKIKTNADAIELLTNGVSAEEVDGVNDLIQYVKEHGTEVTGMKADIKANADAIAAIPQADWNQNDEAAADYIKNRPFYETLATSEIIFDGSVDDFESTITGHTYETDYVHSIDKPLSRESLYEVVYDGVTYSDLQARTAYNYIFVGDEAANKEGFQIMHQNGANNHAVCFKSKDPGPHTFKITEILNTNIIVQLDEKFIPDTIARVADIAAANAAIEALEGKVDTGDKKVSEAIAAAVAEAKTDASNKDAVVLAEAQKAVADAQAALEGQIATKANDADLAAVAKSGLIDDLSIGEGTVLIFDCGNASV